MKIYGLCQDFGKKVCVISAFNQNDLVQRCDPQLIFFSEETSDHYTFDQVPLFLTNRKNT